MWKQSQREVTQGKMGLQQREDNSINFTQLFIQICNGSIVPICKKFSKVLWLDTKCDGYFSQFFQSLVFYLFFPQWLHLFYFLFFKLLFLLYFFHYHFVPLHPTPTHNHCTVAHVHFSFLLHPSTS